MPFHPDTFLLDDQETYFPGLIAFLRDVDAAFAERGKPRRNIRR